MADTLKEKRPPYGIIAVLMIGAFISFLNNTLLNVALPSMMIDLQVGPSTIQWVTTGFMLVNGVLIPTTAFLIQKFSVRKLFLVAIGLFTVGTIIAAVAIHFPILLIARMVQASGSAILMPLLMNVMLVSFPVERRGAAMGVFGFILMFAPAIGPTLSGWIVEHFEWRALFYLIAPIAAVIWIIGFFLLKDKKEKVEIHLDFLSLILSTVGFGGILYGFSSAGDKGWASPFVYLPIVVGIISLTTFILRQPTLNTPMLNFNVYRYPMFALSSVITMVVNMAMFSGMLMIPMYMQTIRGYTPMESGLLMLPGALANAFMSPITGKLFDKYGGRGLAATGLTIITITTFFFSKLSYDMGYTTLMTINAIRMFGMSMVMMPVSTNGLNQLPRRLYPHGTAMNNTLNQMAGAIGTAVMVTLMQTRQNTYFEQYSLDALKSIGGTKLPHNVEIQFKMKAMLGGINDAFLVATFIAAVALILSLFIKRSKQTDEPIELDKQYPLKKDAQGELAAEN